MRLRLFSVIAAVALAASPVMAQNPPAQPKHEQTPGTATTTNERSLNEEAIKAGGAIVTLSPAAVRLMQQRLNQLGYFAGHVTGGWDKDTEEAVNLFQKANNLEPTSTATLPTINCLMGERGGKALLSGEYAGGPSPGTITYQRFLIEGPASGGTRILASPAQIREIQVRLNQTGYDAGNATGVWTPKTAEAARNFQAAHSLDPTGRLDIGLVTALGFNRILFDSGCAGPKEAGSTAGQRFFVQTTQGPGEPISFSPAAVRLVQMLLNREGYHAGELTGIWNEHTQLAAQLFQQANNIEPTATLTTSLLGKIGMPLWYQGQVFSVNMASAGYGAGGVAAAGYPGAGAAGYGMGGFAGGAPGGGFPAAEAYGHQPVPAPYPVMPGIAGPGMAGSGPGFINPLPGAGYGGAFPGGQPGASGNLGLPSGVMAPPLAGAGAGQRPFMQP